MTLGNMREQGVRGLAVFCLNQECPNKFSVKNHGQTAATCPSF
jgi:hypothetical protein